MKASHPEAAAPSRTNPGDTLRNARESKGWSLQAVARQLNLSERSLAQIEAGDFSQMPGHTFARGYVRAYAKLLGLDQGRLVLEFDQHTGTEASGSDVHSLGRIDEPVRLSRGVLRFFGSGLLLVLAVVSVFWWQNRSTGVEAGPLASAFERIEVEAADGSTEVHLLDKPAEQSLLEQPQDADEILPMPLDEVPVALEEVELRAPENTVADPAQPQTDSTASVATEVAAAPEVAAVATQAAAIEPAAAASPADQAQLELQFTAECWVRVTDANGRVLLSALAAAGSEKVLSGKPPLDLHLGFAPGVQVSYNGDAVSLAGHTRGKTARLKLGQ